MTTDKPIKWWEEIKLEDMPEYVKIIPLEKTSPNRWPPVGKVHKWVTEDFPLMGEQYLAFIEGYKPNYKIEGEEFGRLNARHLLPITKEEYLKSKTMNIQKREIEVWVKASELKIINWPLCIRYDGGGAWWYGTVCSMKELQSHISEHNPIEEIEWLKPIKDIYPLTEDELKNIYREGYKEFRSWVTEHPYDEIAEISMDAGFQKFFKSTQQ